MEDDDLRPLRQKQDPKLLETLSIEELRTYIAELEAEIERVRRLIRRREQVRQGADAVFRK